MTMKFTQQGFEAAGVEHGFFGREGGVSGGIYASLNCGAGSNDDPQHVVENRKRVAEEMGVEPENLLSLYQIHSDKCLVITEAFPADNKPQADAFVTEQRGIALGILTADCGPVLFHGQKRDGSPVIGAAHAGWRGAHGGVLEATIAAMNDLGVATEDIKACIGPCIGKGSYEVDDGFFEVIVKEDEEYERFFGVGARDGHHMFDLAGYCAFRLARAGLKTVFITDRDTYAEEEAFFSYRRTTHRKEEDYGRQISAIVIKS